MTVLAVGLMSGTSCDGVDAALVEISDGPSVRLRCFETYCYDTELRDRILNATLHGSPESLALLDVDLGRVFGDAARAMIDQAAGESVEFVASHGHTIWHEPGRASLQLGNAAAIAEWSECRVVNDFRSRDIAAGGQGAPLVPVADALLFGAPDHGRVLLNIGGIANVTWVPRAGSTEGVIAFDTGPGVGLVDLLAHHFRPERRFDPGGETAGRGQADTAVLERLMELPFFDLEPPRSTGRELFGTGMARSIAESVEREEDALATAVEFTARTIRDQASRWIAPQEEGRELVISGGGCHNETLMRRLAHHFDGWRIHRFSELFFDGDAKEAVAFALLGWLTLNSRPGNVPAATGARNARILGTVTPP